MSQKMKTVMISAGGQARVVASILRYDTNIDVVGVLDCDRNSLGEQIGDYEIIGSFDDLDHLVQEGVQAVALCMGDNDNRCTWFHKVKKMGLEVISVIHPTAFIEQETVLGEGVTICAGVIICTHVEVGDGVLVNTGSTIDHETRLKDFSSIAPSCKIAGRVEIGQKSFIGIGVTISHNITIGADVTIGAGSVVVSNIEPGVVAYGVPAKVKVIKG